MSPAMAALEAARRAWENAGRPGPGGKQLVLPVVQPDPEQARVLRSGQ